VAIHAKSRPIGPATWWRRFAVRIVWGHGQFYCASPSASFFDPRSIS